MTKETQNETNSDHQREPKPIVNSKAKDDTENDSNENSDDDSPKLVCQFHGVVLPGFGWYSTGVLYRFLLSNQEINSRLWF